MLTALWRDPSVGLPVQARGWWDPECFCLETVLDQDALVKFLMEQYTPTPILAPWNGGSGFCPNDRTVGIDSIKGSTGDRFSVYREAIQEAERRRAAQGRK